ncbi:hypothetical protein HELRODRAFT_115371 [Helobdella robusta]|uniref:RNA 3'-terminal phosphate cyclase domain-containing protein n=1 Tax=Helobdella robusta TaxID=6412 RepID=T1EG77_HELRO|nr:hypothetical protein HELRODRAFT_115371 [Helobdella robusta]ESN93903.1 hypothetical protein HELRODRAFT_115371 [Helobdella robusta]
MANKGQMLTYEGCNFFRQRVLLATLSGRSLKVHKIRQFDDKVGVSPFEVDLMKLVEKLSKGATIMFSEDTTSLTYHPGLLDGGRVQHDCHTSRGIGYYLELVIYLAPFMKKPLDITLTGVTNNQQDISVDSIQFATLPVLKLFLGSDEGLSLKINKRGCLPEAGGEINFTCPTKPKLRSLQLNLNPSSLLVKRIRGVAWTCRVSPADCKRMTDGAKEVLSGCMLSDVFITSDHRKGPSAGKSPGFGITLVAETKTGVCYCSEAMSNAKGSSSGPSLPEDIGKEAAIKLLLEISKGGCVDSNNQCLASTLMVLNDKDVSKLLVGPLTDYTIHHLRHLRDFFGVTFKIDPREVKDVGRGEDKLLLTCVGVGYKNLSRPIL